MNKLLIILTWLFAVAIQVQALENRVTEVHASQLLLPTITDHNGSFPNVLVRRAKASKIFVSVPFLSNPNIFYILLSVTIGLFCSGSYVENLLDDQDKRASCFLCNSRWSSLDA
ncbi:hypothetical protein BZG36_03006 [Bifiguratus adelaidae]|uniref:Transmembrane protein n=1 Tax=Bifiguratus adelaidae TaxID=1938954 RepID=A0A261XZI9_9FUNG|nr:hypothetical protein BZG36_03006 [Bifiguratus adelaidae]